MPFHSISSRVLVPVAALFAVAFVLTGCSAPKTDGSTDAHRTEAFAFDGSTLDVANDYADVDIEFGESGTVTVDEFLTSVGTSPDDPEWTLDGDTLDLGTTCESTIGICQVSYRLTVPKGTDVELKDTVENAS